MKTSRPFAPLLAFALTACALAAPALARDPLLPDTPPAGVVSDNEFLRRATFASAAESQMGQLAVGLAIDPDVRKQAGAVVADHQAQLHERELAHRDGSVGGRAR